MADKFSEIPYKIYLSEDELPHSWYNLRADMPIKPAPLLNPETHQPATLEELSRVFCTELAKQELDNTTQYIPIPKPVRDFYKMYRPAPLVHASFLEKELNTPAKIFYKFEGNNTSGSHKLNSAIAQAFYAHEQGLKGVTTETGAGQWGTALSMACSFFKMACQVYMVKVSYEQKPFRREVMRTYGASVTPSPSETARSFTPKAVGIDGPVISASSTAVFRPRFAACTAKSSVTRLLPTPPFPLITAITRLTDARAFIGARKSFSPAQEPSFLEAQFEQS